MQHTRAEIFRDFCQLGDDKLLLSQFKKKKKKKSMVYYEGTSCMYLLVEMSLVWFGAQIITEKPLTLSLPRGSTLTSKIVWR